MKLVSKKTLYYTLRKPLSKILTKQLCHDHESTSLKFYKQITHRFKFNTSLLKVFPFQ